MNNIRQHITISAKNLIMHNFYLDVLHKFAKSNGNTSDCSLLLMKLQTFKACSRTGKCPIENAVQLDKF